MVEPRLLKYEWSGIGVRSAFRVDRKHLAWFYVCLVVQRNRHGMFRIVEVTARIVVEGRFSENATVNMFTNGYMSKTGLIAWLQNSLAWHEVKAKIMAPYERRVFRADLATEYALTMNGLMHWARRLES
jgi:hypothetical protein